MQDQLSALLAKAQAEFPTLQTRPDFEAAKARYVGPNGELTALMKQMGAVPKEQRPALGKLINETKTQLQALLDATLLRLEQAELAGQLGAAVDPTLPAPESGPGTYHPLTLVREEMCRILRKVGFVVADGLLVALEEAGCGEEGGLCAPIPGFAAFAGAGSGAASGAGLTALPLEAAGEAALLLDEAGEADGTEEGVDDWPGLEVDVPDHEDAGAGADAGSRGAFSYELVTLPVAAPEPPLPVSGSPASVARICIFINGTTGRKRPYTCPW